MSDYLLGKVKPWIFDTMRKKQITIDIDLEQLNNEFKSKFRVDEYIQKVRKNV